MNKRTSAESNEPIAKPRGRPKKMKKGRPPKQDHIVDTPNLPKPIVFINSNEMNVADSLPMDYHPLNVLSSYSAKSNQNLLEPIASNDSNETKRHLPQYNTDSNSQSSYSLSSVSSRVSKHRKNMTATQKSSALLKNKTLQAKKYTPAPTKTNEEGKTMTEFYYQSGRQLFDITSKTSENSLSEIINSQILSDITLQKTLQNFKTKMILKEDGGSVQKVACGSCGIMNLISEKKYGTKTYTDKEFQWEQNVPVNSLQILQKTTQTTHIFDTTHKDENNIEYSIYPNLVVNGLVHLCPDCSSSIKNKRLPDLSLSTGLDFCRLAISSFPTLTMWETLCISTQSVNMHLLKLKLTRNASSDMSFQSAITGTIILIQVTVSLFLIMDQRKYLKYYRGEILTILLLLCLWEK
jgi:hypothetical protein